MQSKRTLSCAAVGIVWALACPAAKAVSFEAENVRGSFDSTLSVGAGIRADRPDCRLVTQGASGSGAPTGCLAPTAGLGDQGNLNYDRGDIFTGYLKGSHELLLKMPGEMTLLARANWVRDFASTRTTGITSATTPAGIDDGQTQEARKDLRFKGRILDLWVSKSFDIGGQQARVRVGNQVINWGESLYLPGGINSTNAIDVMRLSQLGTQLKEAVLPAPMVSVASGLGGGVNVEAYVQTNWNKSYLPPVGSYWSTSNVVGTGSDQYGFPEGSARNRGQWGAAMRWQPRGTQVNLGLYALNYHDKLPQLQIDQAAFTPSWTYAEDRRLYGISANFPVGDWAVGTELSYRPKDAVSLSPTAGCTAREGRCWVDEKRWQWHLTGLLSLTPGNAGGFLDFLGASTATFLSELVVIRYPKLQPSYDGDPVAAGYWGWGQETDPTAAPAAVGTRTSTGINFGFSFTYDGTLIDGWQVVPEVYYFQALSGRTPNVTALLMNGAKSVNFTLGFIRNPATWQFALNYARFMGGTSPFDQPLRDRHFLGLVLSRNL